MATTGSGSTWSCWVSSTSSTSTCTATSDGIWDEWIGTGSTTNCTSTCSTTSTNYVIWQEWTSSDGRREVRRIQPQQRAVTRETEEERQKREAELAVLREEQLERARKAKEKREAAKKRSMELLYSLLTEKQKETLRKERFFEVMAPSGNKYHIRDAGNVANVIAIDFNRKGVKKKRQKLCAHPRLYHDGKNIPQGDVMIGQMLALQANEEQFLKVANLY